jgi:hypothetical protein
VDGSGGGEVSMNAEGRLPGGPQIQRSKARVAGGRDALAARVVAAVAESPGSTSRSIVASVGARRQDVLATLSGLLGTFLRVEQGPRRSRVWFVVGEGTDWFPRRQGGSS